MKDGREETEVPFLFRFHTVYTHNNFVCSARGVAEEGSLTPKGKSSKPSCGMETISPKFTCPACKFEDELCSILDFKR